MGKKEGEKVPGSRLVEAGLLTFLCILINYGGRFICIALSLPCWLDTLGVLIESYALGPLSGAVVGATQSIMISKLDPSSLIYLPVNILVGIAAGVFSRRGEFKTPISAFSFATFLSLFTAGVSTVLNLVFSDGKTSNVWPDAVIELLTSVGVFKWLSTLIGQIYLEFLDKVIVVLVFYIILILWHGLLKRTGGRAPGGEEKKKAAAKGKKVLSSFLIFAGALSILSFERPIPTEAAAYNTPTVNVTSCQEKVFNATNGLTPGHATDIKPTLDGVLWIGSNAGLYRYDGVQFEYMDIPEIRNVNCLYVDKQGRLFVGTNDNGIVVLDGREVVDHLDTEKGLCSDSIRMITQDPDGLYYIATSDYLQAVDFSGGIINRYKFTGILNTSYLTGNENGLIACTGGDGILYLIRDGSVKARLKSPDGGSFTTVRIGEGGKIYAGTDRGDIVSFQEEGDEVKEAGSIPTGQGAAINEIDLSLGGGRILCLTDKGLIQVSDGAVALVNTGTFIHSLQRMTVDYQGNIWIASARDGLLLLTDSPFSNVFDKCGAAPGLVNACIKHQGLLYAGCDDGIRVINEKEQVTLKTPLSEELAGVRISCFAEGMDHSLYIGTSGKGLFRLAPDGTLSPVEGEKGPGDNVFCLTIEKDGTIAAGGDRGLSLIREGEAIAFLSAIRFGNSPVLSLLDTGDGLLVGTNGNGLFKIRDGVTGGHKTKADGLGSDVILKIIPLKAAGAILYVTSNGLVLDGPDGFQELNNFPYSNNYDVLEKDGMVYITGSAGLYVLPEDNIRTVKAKTAALYNDLSGFPYRMAANSTNLVDGDDLLLCSGAGVIRVDTKRFTSGSYPIRSRVLSITADGEKYDAEGAETISLPHYPKEVVIEGEILNYLPYSPILSCRLKGKESEFREIRPEDFSNLIYTDLGPGDYTFELRLLDPATGGILSERETSFVVEEALYDTVRFKIYLILIPVFFAAWLAWYLANFRQQKKKKIEEEARKRKEEEEERERALEREREQQKLREAREQVSMGNKAVISIAKALYAKDKRTGEHSHKVAYYAVQLARAYGFSDEECTNLKRAALLHDIGKIAIPDAVLNKPGKLTDAEYEILKTHTTVGYDILKGFTMIRHVDEGARYHHERYDGKGYPDGLKGEEIPLYGRIIAVADSYDAMTENRVYRKGLDMDHVIVEMEKGRGTQFDPELDDIFLGLIKEGKMDPETIAAKVKGRGLEEDFDNEEGR